MNFENLLKITISEHISIMDVLLRLIVAGISGLIISLIYRLYHGKESSEPDMMHSLIFLSLIICIAMMVIGNNLASAFGLVGAVSIIRFRTSVKSARDMSFVFFTVVMGMACGLGFISLALMGLVFTVFIMLGILLVSSKSSKKNSYKTTHEIKINYRGSATERVDIEKILNEYGSSIFFKNLKVEEDKVIVLYGISLESLDSFDAISNSLRENPKFVNIKISLGQFEKKS